MPRASNISGHIPVFRDIGVSGLSHLGLGLRVKVWDLHSRSLFRKIEGLRVRA